MRLGTAIVLLALGAILTFAGGALYPAHRAGAALWGLTPLGDQQLAGTIMWVPAGAVYLATMAVLFLGWLKDVERRTHALGTVEGRG